jgi:hypothetical protein
LLGGRWTENVSSSSGSPPGSIDLRGSALDSPAFLDLFEDFLTLLAFGADEDDKDEDCVRPSAAVPTFPGHGTEGL